MARFHLHSQQLRVDAATGSTARVSSAVISMEWSLDRLSPWLNAEELAAIDDGLDALRGSVAASDLVGAADVATRLAQDVRNDTAA